jgi:hypothetical protein
MNPQNLIQMANELRSNPMSVLSKFGISEDIANDLCEVRGRFRYAVNEDIRLYNSREYT